MRCKNAKILISASMDGELSQREERVLQRHVHRCAECAREQAEVSNLRDVMSAWTDEEPSEWLAESFAYKLNDEMERRTARPARRSRRVFGTALAGFATALLAFGIIMHSQLLPPETNLHEKPTVEATQPADPSRSPDSDSGATSVETATPDSGPSGGPVAVGPRNAEPMHNRNIVRTPGGTTYVRPRPAPAPPSYSPPATSDGPGPPPGRAVTTASDNGGSRTRTTDLASRGTASRDAEIRRMVLRKLALASSAENNTESTVAVQLAKADLTMNESVEEVRGIIRKAADNLARPENRVDTPRGF